MCDLDNSRIDVRNFCGHANKEVIFELGGLTGLTSDLRKHEFFYTGR
jgi:hypothetical protein